MISNSLLKRIRSAVVVAVAASTFFAASPLFATGWGHRHCGFQRGYFGGGLYLGFGNRVCGNSYYGGGFYNPGFYNTGFCNNGFYNTGFYNTGFCGNGFYSGGSYWGYNGCYSACGPICYSNSIGCFGATTNYYPSSIQYSYLVPGMRLADGALVVSVDPIGQSPIATGQSQAASHSRSKANSRQLAAKPQPVFDEPLQRIGPDPIETQETVSRTVAAKPQPVYDEPPALLAEEENEPGIAAGQVSALLHPKKRVAKPQPVIDEPPTSEKESVAIAESPRRSITLQLATKSTYDRK